MIGSWVLFPLLLIVLSVGCALLLERACRVRIPGALLLPVGLAAVIVAGHFTTSTDATAELTAPLAVALAIAGYAMSPRWQAFRLDPGMLVAPLVVYVVYGAPIILSGEPTMAGYIRLDDTSTWLALTDRVMEHGHSLDGLAPSSYEAALAFNLGDGYPVGVFVPLGIGSLLTGIDSAWLIHPYMSVAAASIALCLWHLLEPVVRSRPLRAAAAAIAAQPALLVGYVQWGGVKEIVAASLIVLSVALLPNVVGERTERGWLVVLGVVVAALLAVLSLGGAAWVVPPLLAGAAIVWRRFGHREALERAGGLAAVTVVLSLPLLLPALLDGRLLPPTSASLTSETAKGNLIEPLGLERLLGVWPAGDFRLDAVDPDVAVVLVVVVGLAAAVGLWYAVRSGALALALYGGGVAVAAVFLVALGSPWVDGKAMATASPALLALAVAGTGAAITRGRSVEGSIALVAIAIGVVWSNVLAYRDANLAPYDQLAELERIGEDIAGEGPTLMTEYQPYGVRHFLREADPEAVSELRRREIPLRDGGTVTKGFWADTDELALDGLTVYRTLVLRRSPVQSRPPAPYALAFSGEYYEVWQRPAGPAPAIAEHLPLGGELDPAASASCADVRELADLAGSGTVAAEHEPPVIALPMAEMAHPAAWLPGDEGTLVPSTDGTVTTEVTVPEPGTWTVWLRGSIRGQMTVNLDGREAGSVRHLLNNAGLYAELASVSLDAGEHSLELDYSGSDLAHPGSGGAPHSIGPVVLSKVANEDESVQLTNADGAAELCGTRLDWIEAVG